MAPSSVARSRSSVLPYLLRVMDIDQAWIASNNILVVCDFYGAILYCKTSYKLSRILGLSRKCYGRGGLWLLAVLQFLLGIFDWLGMSKWFEECWMAHERTEKHRFPPASQFVVEGLCCVPDLPFLLVGSWAPFLDEQLECWHLDVRQYNQNRNCPWIIIVHYAHFNEFDLLSNLLVQKIRIRNIVFLPKWKFRVLIKNTGITQMTTIDAATMQTYQLFIVKMPWVCTASNYRSIEWSGCVYKTNWQPDKSLL